LGELTALPQTPSWIWGAILLREGEGKGKGWRGEARGGGNRGGERREKERVMSPPSIWRKFTPMFVGEVIRRCQVSPSLLASELTVDILSIT